MKALKHLAIAGALWMTPACDKEERHACFDKALYRENKKGTCLLDCPGVTGCDGKFYCNACIAAREGIRAE